MINRPLSVGDFKKWLSEQSDLSEFFNIGREIEDPNEKFVGKAVRSKVGEKKLLERIETEDNPEILVREFLEEGGTIVSMEDKRAQVEVESGAFYIPRFCIKIQKN